MKVLGFLLLVGLLIGVPLFLLSEVVMPDLTSLQYSYAHFDETAQTIAGQSQ